LSLLAEIRFPAIDSVILNLPGPLAIRWYGLTYLIGFLIGAWILGRLSKRSFLPIDKTAVQDWVIWLVFGVLIGGRLGFIAFYKPEIFASPLEILKVWEGGMSFHGGLLGVVLALLLFARRRGVSALRLVDSAALAVTPGIFCVRMANFINGELYGRVTDASVPWAIRFPTDPVGSRLLGLGALAPDAREERLLQALRGDEWDRLMGQVPLRHPSQIYEGLSEGLLLGAILLLVYRLTRKRPLGPGAYGGIFLLGYGCFRFFLEFYRQPDEQFAEHPGELGTVLGPFSMGQLLCFGMILASFALLFYAKKKRAKPA